MGRTIMQKETPQVDLSTLEKIRDFDVVYHDREDTLFVRPTQPRPATSVDWNGEIWIRVDPKNGEIVGLEIDDFETFFLKKHPELAEAWAQAKPLCHRKKSSKYTEEYSSFLLIVLNFFKDLFKDNPQQTSIRLMPAFQE